MNSLARIKPTSRIRVLETPTAAIRWDLCLLALLALIGVLSHPAPRG
jgi:hypothetical protein